MNTNNMDNLFNQLKGQWDVEEPAPGHQDRFLDKLERRRRKKISFRSIIPFAAAALIVFGLFINWPHEKPVAVNGMANISPKVRETQVYFASIIEKELTKIEKENSPETRKLVKDALYHMQELEDDYNKLTAELLKKGENKQIIHAMIVNLQTRISFLEEVMTRIENTKKLKEQYNDISQS